MSAVPPDKRPDPDALLARVQQDEARQRRGKLKVFFGASAGVGKTYAMLEAARKRHTEGADVVVGYVEPHGRDETERLLEGLEQLPFRITEYRGASLPEFDLDAALARKPALVLVDEFAHTNVVGSRHAKRWQDVEELLAAGIDVYTTVNVQHIESLNDVVAQITGARMQETVPDKVFDQADEIELIDITPDELLQRLKEGKVYLPERAQHALENFFRKGNLIALRELAMRAAADRVDAEMREYRDGHAIRDTWAAGECLMVCVGPDAQAEKLVRAGKRMAMALHARWLVVYVETPELLRLPEAERNRRIDLLRLAESLGAEAVTLDGPTAAQALLEYARTRNVNRILVGKPNRRGWRSWLRPSTTNQLVKHAGDVDVYVVSGEDAARVRLGPVLARSSAYLGLAAGGSGKKRARGYAWAVAASALCTAICWVLKAWFDLPNLIMVYLLGASIIAARFGRGPAVMSAMLNVAAFDFFFVPPFFSFAVSDTQYLVTFAVMLAVTLIIGNLTASVRLQAHAGGEVADDQRNREHDGAGHQILRVGNGKRKKRRHEKEIECRDVEHRGHDRRTAAEARGDDRRAEQVDHDQIGQIEPGLEDPADCGAQSAGSDCPGVAARALLARASGRQTEIGAAAREHRAEAHPGSILPTYHVDVHVAGMFYELVGGRGPQPAPPAAPVRLAHQDAVDVARSGVFEQCLGCGRPIQRHAFGTQRFGQPQQVDAPVALGFGQPQQLRRFDVDHQPARMQGHSHALAGAHQLLRLRIRSDAHHQAFARGPGIAYRMPVAVLAHFRVHPVRGRAHCEFAQRDQVALAEKILQRMLGPLRQIDLAFLQPLQQLVGRDVDEFDFVGLVEHLVRHGLLHACAGDLGDDVV